MRHYNLPKLSNPVAENVIACNLQSMLGMGKESNFTSFSRYLCVQKMTTIIIQWNPSAKLLLL